MNIGVYKPKNMPTSISNYYAQIRHGLESIHDCTFLEFDHPRDFCAEMDICWDPRGGRGAPPPWLTRSPAPIVATYHGAVHLALPLYESVGINIKNIFRGLVERKKTIAGWNYFSDKRLHVITVSEYAREEFSHIFSIDKNKIQSIHHGVDAEIFNNTPHAYPGNYLLHISAYQPKKNIKRIIKAYNRIKLDNKPRLIIISPGINFDSAANGIDIIRNKKSQKDLAIYYKNAIAFVFPSLHETFGLPILEAMSSGCPVITSNNTACQEVASSAAICIDPRNINELTHAMETLIASSERRANLKSMGLSRVKEYTWNESANHHYEFFTNVIKHEFNKYFWDKRYKEYPIIGSGPGSRGYSKWYKKNLLVEVIKNNNIHSLIDVGCGDMALFRDGNIELDKYLGIDISKEIISINKRANFKISSNEKFITHDISEQQLQCDDCDLVLCLDVLIHQLKKEDFYSTLKNIFAINSKYFLISYQDNEGSVSTEVLGEIPDEVMNEELSFRDTNKNNTSMKRADVAWHGRFEKIINDHFPLLKYSKVGSYRGQSVYLVQKS